MRGRAPQSGSPSLEGRHTFVEVSNHDDDALSAFEAVARLMNVQDLASIW